MRLNNDYIKHIANQASICLNACNLYIKRQKERQELDKIIKNLSLLYNIGRAMTYISDLKNLLKYILGKAIDITRAEKGSIMLYDPDTNQLSVSFIEGLEDHDYQEKINNKQVECKKFKPGEGVAGQAFQEAKPLILNNTRGQEEFVEADSSFVRSIACIPMLVYNEAIGVINVTNKRDDTHFTEVDIEMLKAVTDQAAVAINKAQLQEVAYILSERLRKGFSQIRLDKLPGQTISLGISSYPEDGKDIETLIKNADTAMYAAKQNGRNRVVKFSQSNLDGFVKSPTSALCCIPQSFNVR